MRMQTMRNERKQAEMSKYQLDGKQSHVREKVRYEVESIFDVTKETNAPRWMRTKPQRSTIINPVHHR